MENRRILAVSIDNALFDKLDEYVKDEKISKQQYVAEVLRKDLAQRLQQKQVIKEPEVISAKAWDKEEVEKAIDDFILQNGRVPSQKEFKNENGLPSYGAAGRALESSPAQHANQRLMELSNMDEPTEENQNGIMSMM